MHVKNHRLIDDLANEYKVKISKLQNQIDALNKLKKEIAEFVSQDDKILQIESRISAVLYSLRKKYEDDEAKRIAII